MVSCQFALHYLFEKEVSEDNWIDYRACCVASLRMYLVF